MDAVNPAYFDAESQPDQEQPMDPQGDISPFSLTDQVGNLFRSHKIGKHAQKTHARPTQGERAVNLGVEEQSMVNGRLPADEQDECYKQQNIESPSQEEPPRGNWVKDQEPQAMPVMDIAQEPQTWMANEGGQEVNEKRDKPFGGREIEKQEVDSLYSGPEQVLKLKKVKSSSHSRSPEVFSECSRVDKPLGVQAEFPVYDEDLDFHPDPLQGILDDKYWLDPQEQEAVIRKYVDLAANNMMPAGMDYGKRNAEKADHKVKSVNSKIGFKDVDSQCPCKEISACGDCSKGKGQKKTNSSESGGENILYGRKLLSIDHKAYNMDESDHEKTYFQNNDEVSSLSKEKSSEYSQNYMPDDHESNGLVSVDDGDAPMYDNLDGLLSFKGRKLLFMKENSVTLGNEEEINNNSPKMHDVIGRKILWYGVYDEDEESYSDEDDEEVENSHSIFGKVSADRQIVNEELNDWLEDDHSKSLSKNGRTGIISDQHISENHHDKFHLNNLTTNNNQFDHNLKEIKMSELKTPNKPPGYYMSNKLANMMQKPFEEKPKGSKKNMTDPTYEFELMRNKTLYNATFEATSVKPPRPKICFKRGDRNYLSAPKNRRSNSDLPMVGKNQHVVPLVQSSDGSTGSDANNALNSSKQPDVSTTKSQAINCTFASTNVTTVSPHNASQLTSNHSKQGKFDDRDVEETVDAEVANDIVETVISESEKSSVLGHNLGVCRRNESVTKMKYGQIVPEAEKVLKSVTDCIMDRIKAHLAVQSCILLDNELLEFLKWMVLSGESYKEYMQRLGPKYYDFVPVTTANVTTCGPPTSQICEQEPLPPNPNVVSSLDSNSAKVYR